MALTNDDKQWIKEAIVEGVNGALETIVLPRFDAVEADISELKRDVSELKETRIIPGRGAPSPHPRHPKPRKIEANVCQGCILLIETCTSLSIGQF